MKVLNLYAGIGGNRKLWTDVEVTAVEYNSDIAKIYQDNFPGDTVIVGDAHKYLLNHYDEYDFIWSSPPCPSHSDIRRAATHRGQQRAIYPEMSLYQEIILLDNYAKKGAKYVVENVMPYYDPLIPPSVKLGRHLFWCNYYVSVSKFVDNKKPHNNINATDTVYGFNLIEYKINNKIQILRNLVNPEIGEHFLLRAMEIEKEDKFKQQKLF